MVPVAGRGRRGRRVARGCRRGGLVEEEEGGRESGLVEGRMGLEVAAGPVLRGIEVFAQGGWRRFGRGPSIGGLLGRRT